MQEIANLENVPHHEVERRLRDEFSAELGAGERGIKADIEARIKWISDHWPRFVAVIRDLEALFGAGDGGDSSGGAGGQ